MTVMGRQHTPTVLLVQDSSDDREMYAAYFRLQHLRTVAAGDTADALALAHTTDVIVTGIQVPGPFDGVELVRRLRQMDATQDTPIIVLTACVTKRDKQHAVAAGCDAFLPKPCPPDQLLSEIRRMLALHQESSNDVRQTG